MKIDVDFDRCEGHGLCEDQAPEIFRLDDDGDLHVKMDDIPEDRAAAARSAIAACPVAALRERA
ncbi:ferredoxin [Rhodococcoides corynebacterioides]|uniref:Ferredoxin n=1 Tax=Rhodococcoides corynebacterioides TaxID=53972 RepID=A0ABS7NYM0_9NOCA|nr:ferredoxin [Rhodococcus corynebacterioides]MBY6348953.1 ferredoxin [Rhodococcus corynebacterioides]MBY6365230.1 ferredoxin [Rhodococcus corynebacterioides]MBY6406642.1 ferredoxin [Rhodococcus corynebacterioides]